MWGHSPPHLLVQAVENSSHSQLLVEAAGMADFQPSPLSQTGSLLVDASEDDSKHGHMESQCKWKEPYRNDTGIHNDKGKVHANKPVIRHLTPTKLISKVHLSQHSACGHICRLHNAPMLETSDIPALDALVCLDVPAMAVAPVLLQQRILVWGCPPPKWLLPAAEMTLAASHRHLLIEAVEPFPLPVTSSNCSPVGLRL